MLPIASCNLFRTFIRACCGEDRRAFTCLLFIRGFWLVSIVPFISSFTSVLFNRKQRQERSCFGLHPPETSRKNYLSRRTVLEQRIDLQMLTRLRMLTRRVDGMCAFRIPSTSFLNHQKLTKKSNNNCKAFNKSNAYCQVRKYYFLFRSLVVDYLYYIETIFHNTTTLQLIWIYYAWFGTS